MEDLVVPIIVAIVASSITFFATRRRIALDAAVEIARYREKWLEQLRHEVMEIISLTSRASVKKLGVDDAHELIKRIALVKLLVSDSNEHWDEFQKSLTNIFDRAIGDKDPSDFHEAEPFIDVSKRILKDEWNEIQRLLYEKNK